MAWQPIAANDIAAHRRFVDIMQQMDSRYLGLTQKVLFDTLQNPEYSAFGRLPNGNWPDSIDLVLLAHDDRPHCPEIVMLGWSPADLNQLDQTITDVFTKSDEWLRAVPNDPDKTYNTVRCFIPDQMGSVAVKKLHEGIKAVVEQPLTWAPRRRRCKTQDGTLLYIRDTRKV